MQVKGFTVNTTIIYKCISFLKAIEFLKQIMQTLIY